MAEEGGNGTSEYKAFKACTPQLVSAIKGNLGIADKLLAEGLISEDTYEYCQKPLLVDRTKAEKFVTRVRAKIQESKQNYFVFYNILEEERVYYRDLLAKLEVKKKSIIVEDRERREQVVRRSTKWIVFVPAILVLLLAMSLLFYHQPQQRLTQESSRLTQVLRDHYEQITEIDYDQYLPQNMEGYHIPFIVPNIIPIDHPQASSMGITVGELFNTIKAGTKLAITGRPGVGKSTLARHIVKLWAQRKALPQFDILFHICLGRVTTNITGLQSLMEEECHGLVTDDPELEVNKLVKRIQETKGDRVAFVLDALDEYYPSQLQKNDHVFKIIKNISLPKSSLIVTSRSRKIDDVRNYFTQIVEVAGFNETDIDISLIRLGPPLGPVIAQYLDQNPNVKNMCYLPLHMTMIIYLASLKVDTLSLIDTETKIYSNFLYLTIENYHTRRHKWNRNSLSVCFEESQPQNDLCVLFAKVCELAYNATVEKQQTFTSSEIDRLRLPSDKLEALSLFKIKKENRRQGSIDVYYFSHQTFQEFMAACHLFMLPEKQQTKIISRHNEMQAIFADLIWKFFFGLVGENRNEEMLFDLFSTFVSSSGYKQLDSYYYVIDLYPLIYAYETGKRNETFASIFSKSNITGPGNNHSLHIQIEKPMDLRAIMSFDGRTNLIFLNYALRWIPIISIKLELQVSTTHPDPRLCTDEYRAIAANQTKLFSAYCSPKINTSSNVILELEYFRKLYNLDPQLLVSTLKSVALVDHSHAKKLRLELLRYIKNQRANSTRIVPFLEDAVTSMKSTHNLTSDVLSEEELKFIKLNYPLQQHIQAYHSSSLELMNFVGLRKFKLQNSLSDYDLQSICEGLKSATTLETLDLSHNFLSDPSELLILFPSFKQLKNLDLSGNWIPLERLATGFKYLTHLNKVDLSGNLFFGHSNTFSTNLIYLKQLRQLDLSQTKFECNEEFAFGLRHLTELRKLSVSQCLLENKHLEELAKSFKHLSNLEELDLSYNYIDDLSNTNFLLSQIREINLSNNFINQPLSKLIILLLPRSRLRKINLSNNFLCADEEQLRFFLRQFARSSEVREVDLSYNMIFLGDELKRKSRRIRFDTQSHTKEIKLEGSKYIADKAYQRYAACVCEQARYSDASAKLRTELYCYVEEEVLTENHRPILVQTTSTPKLEYIKDYVIGNFTRKQKTKIRERRHYEEKRNNRFIDRLRSIHYENIKPTL